SQLHRPRAYPQTAETEHRCIGMLADPLPRPGKTTGTRTQGSSEAIMLGALSLKCKWRARREAAGTTGPNLVFGGDVNVVWENVCRYLASSRGSSRCSPTSTSS